MQRRLLTGFITISDKTPSIEDSKGTSPPCKESVETPQLTALSDVEDGVGTGPGCWAHLPPWGAGGRCLSTGGKERRQIGKAEGKLSLWAGDWTALWKGLKSPHRLYSDGYQ